LDFLRGVAILLVLGAHATGAIPFSKSGVFRPVAAFCNNCGWTGVDLFFVLSGFLVGGLLLAEIRRFGRFDARRFIVRRGLKIWPSYYVFIGYSMFANVRAHHSVADTLRAFLPNLLHIQSYVPTPSGLDHTWSLAVEEHFYLLLPLLLWYLTRAPENGLLKRLPWVFGGIAVACLAMRTYAVFHCPYPQSDSIDRFWCCYTPTHLRIDGLMFGVVLAYLYHIRPETLRPVRESAAVRWGLVAVGFLLLSPAMLINRLAPASGPHLITWMITLVYLGYGCLLLACVHSNTPDGRPSQLFRGWVGRAIAFVGFYSYTIYLWHLRAGQDVVLHMVRTGRLPQPTTPVGWLLVMALFFVGAVGAGIVLSRVVEIPTLAFRDRFFPRADSR
jgi:peptidoglycan/LPS O-acetylase OafA/YrhL